MFPERKLIRISGHWLEGKGVGFRGDVSRREQWADFWAGLQRVSMRSQRSWEAKKKISGVTMKTPL